MSLTELQKRPGNVPLKYHREPRHGYSFVYPEYWQRFDLVVDGGHGALFAEDPDDRSTCLSVESRDIETSVTAADLPTLREGFIGGLRKIPGIRILRRTDYDVGFLIGLEAQFDFDEDGLRRRRWVRVLYQGTVQARLIAQGKTIERFKYWLPCFKPAMTGFVFDGGFAPLPPNGADAGQDWASATSELTGAVHE